MRHMKWSASFDFYPSPNYLNGVIFNIWWVLACLTSSSRLPAPWRAEFKQKKVNELSGMRNLTSLVLVVVFFFSWTPYVDPRQALFCKDQNIAHAGFFFHYDRLNRW